MYYSMKQFIYNDELSFSIFCFGNPVIWWGAIPAMLVCVWMWIRNREERIAFSSGEPDTASSLDTGLIFLLVGFLAQYLPWTLVPRGTYIYHYFASVPFLILALTLGMHQLRLRFLRCGRAASAAFLALAAASFVLFFPYASGILSPVSWLDVGREFLRIWY